MYKPWYSYLYIKSPIIKIGLAILSIGLALVVTIVVLALEEDRMAAQTGNWEGRSIEKGAEIYANNCSSCHGAEGQGVPGPALNSKYFFTQRLTDVNFTGSLGDYVKLTVAAGRPSKTKSQWPVIMPTWSSTYGGPLRPDQVEQVTNYVLNWEESAVQQTNDEDPWIAFEDAPSKGAPADAAAAPAEPMGNREPQVIFTELACSGCHKLDQDQTDSNLGQPGPNFGNLYDHAGTRVAGQDAATYVHNSIVNPNDFVVPTYMANIMPQGLADKMTAEELDALVTWLLDPNRAQ